MLEKHVLNSSIQIVPSIIEGKFKVIKILRCAKMSQLQLWDVEKKKGERIFKYFLFFGGMEITDPECYN